MKLITIKKREVSVYGMEVILLNGGVLASTLFLSLVADCIEPYVWFILIFCPLRMVAGGFHAKRAGTCFAISNLIFLLFLILQGILRQICGQNSMAVMGTVALLALFLTGPIERQNVMISQEEHRMHLWKMDLLLLTDLLLLGATDYMNYNGIYSIALSLCFVEVLHWGSAVHRQLFFRDIS